MPDMPEEQIPASENKNGGEAGEKMEENAAAISHREVPQAPEQKAEQGERLEGKYLEILQKTAPQASPHVTKDDETATTAKQIGALGDEEAKVARLLELAEQKGVVQAVKVAYALKDYYILDRMHDELADTLYSALKSKGLVQE